LPVGAVSMVDCVTVTTVVVSRMVEVTVTVVWALAKVVVRIVEVKRV